MRALFVAPYLPTPGSGGRTRLLSLLDGLGARHELALVAFVGEGQQAGELSLPGHAVPLPPLPERPAGVRGAMRFYAERAATPLPTFATYVRSERMRAAIAETCAAFDPEVVVVTTTEMAQYLDAVPEGVPRVLDLQDVSSRWMARAAATGTRKQRALLRLEVLKTRRYEARAARRAEVVTVTSPAERSFLLRLAGVEAAVVPNGVDTRHFVDPADAERIPNRLVFVGPLTSQANHQALRWFCEEVLPALRSRAGALTLDVVGEPAGEGWPSEVRLLGRAPDVRAPMAAATVNVVPIRVGSGTRYKILEALSMGHAVVSTTVGAEGLGVADGIHLRLADEPEPFADAVASLLADPEGRARLGRRGRAHVVARFDWTRIVARMEEAWVVARRRRTASA